MEKKGVIVLLFVLVVVFSLGFTLFQGGDTSGETIKAKTISAINGVDTYRFSTEIEVGIQGEIQGVQVNKKDKITGSGAVDVPAKKMLFDVKVESTPAIDGAGQKMKAFFVGNKVFFQSGESVVVEDIPDADIIWSQRTQLKQQSQILAKSAVKLIGEENINGKDTYVLELSPERKDLVRYIAEQASVSGAPLQVSESRVSDLTGMVDDASISIWIGKEDYLPAKFSLYMRLSSEDIERVTEIVMFTWDYGEPVDTTSPEIV